MGKWLAAGGVVLLALAALLLYQLKATTTVDAAPRAAAVATAAPSTISGAPLPSAAPVAPVPPPAVEDPSKPKKISLQSDAFFREFDDPQPHRLMAQAAKCYNRTNRVSDFNAKMKLTFRNRIKDGEVTVIDVKMVESTLNNPALEACMIKAVSTYHWHNDALPDWEGEDILLVRPERGMKKFTAENNAYEGSGPEFPGGKAKEPVPAERPTE